MDRSGITLVPATMQSMVDMAMQIKHDFDDADRDGEDNPELVHLIEQPDALREMAVTQCADQMTTFGQLLPPIHLLSRRRTTIITLAGGMPHEREEQVWIWSILTTLIAVTSIEAYWLASEAWIAKLSDDEQVNKLSAGNREDKDEAVLIITATPTRHGARYCRIDRAPDGDVSGLRDIGYDGQAVNLDNPLLGNMFAYRDRMRAMARQKVKRP